jgi:Bifunctional DNA primase/polymerase, N-terminal
VTRTNLLDAALAAAADGWPLFPLGPGRKRPRAELTAWEERATLDPECIASWWRAHPHDNIGVTTGPAGLVVVDLDCVRPGETRPPEWPAANGGADVLAALAERHGQEVSATRTVATPSGGRHLYYRAPKVGGPWRNTTGRIGWHVDTRAAGGYVVAAGSMVDGRSYTVVDDRAVVELPGWLAQLLAPVTDAPPLPARPSLSRQGYAMAALRGEVDRVLGARPGERNAALNRAAWNLARHIATGLLGRAVVEKALYDAGLAAGGQTPAGVRATVRSAINARLRRPLGPVSVVSSKEGTR